MIKENIKQLNLKKIISTTEFSIVYELNDGRIFKRFLPNMLQIMQIRDFNIADKINSASPIDNVPEILIPLSSVYEDGIFIGYTMTKAKGVELSSYDKNFTLKEQCDLKGINERYLILEDIVKRANEKGIIFPDFLTLENIFIDENNNYQFVDYEGIQIKNKRVIQISDGLGNQFQHLTPKYYQNSLFTTNLDKKSLIYYYFLDTFHINLAYVNVPIDGHLVTLDQVFYEINLTDYDLQHKVWKSMTLTGDNYYIGDDIKRIAEEYTLSPVPTGDEYIKKLIKK